MMTSNGLQKNHVSYLSCSIDIAGDLCHQIRQGISGFIGNQITWCKARLWLNMWVFSVPQVEVHFSATS